MSDRSLSAPSVAPVKARLLQLLDEVIATLLDDMYRIAEDNQCLLETSFHEPATDTYWD